MSPRRRTKTSAAKNGVPSPPGSKTDKHRKKNRRLEDKRQEERRPGDRARSAPKALPDQKASRAASEKPAAPAGVEGSSALAPEAPWMRSRMLARTSGVIMSGIALLPGTETLHPGLRCAALVILLLDVLTETVGQFVAVWRAVRKVLRIEPVQASENADGELALNFGVILRSMPKLPKVRITGRVLSASLLAAQWLDDLQALHTEMLAIAVTVLTFDVVTEASSRIRTRMERWLNDLKSRSRTNEGR